MTRPVDPSSYESTPLEFIGEPDPNAPKLDPDHPLASLAWPGYRIPEPEAGSVQEAQLRLRRFAEANPVFADDWR